MSRLRNPYPVVDLFAGPGGLGEGFASLTDGRGKRRFDSVVAIERDEFSHQTLFLRHFMRGFPDGEAPDDYYDFLKGELTADQLFKKHPAAFAHAKKSALRISLGDDSHAAVKRTIRDRLAGEERWALVGGPPCQAYSLVGRSRMMNCPEFEQDERHTLYLEYLKIIIDHRPPIFVMENVKGLLSATIEGKSAITRIVRDLSNPKSAISQGSNGLSYKLYSLSEQEMPDEEVDPKLFVVRAEDYGIPQARHRMFIVGIRSDLNIKPGRLKSLRPPTVRQTIGSLPAVRSSLSKGTDSPETWRKEIARIASMDIRSQLNGATYARAVAQGVSLSALAKLNAPEHTYSTRYRGASGSSHQVLKSLHDPRLKVLTSHEARGHMASDLRRYPDNDVAGVRAAYHIWDIARFQRQRSSRGHKEALDIDFVELFGDGINCLPANLGSDSYQSYLIVMPAMILSKLYDRYSARLLEQNVRTFLQARAQVNKGIRATIINEPQMFFAYNNGVTATAQDVETRVKDGHLQIVRMTDLQIVNGGQTTASLFHTQRRDKADLSGIFVQMKLSVIDSEQSELVVPRISEYANTQNRVNAADFFSNHPFHVRMADFSRRLWAPPQQGAQRETKWFYERARGQYLDAQSKLTPGEQKRFKAEYPKPQMFTKTDLAKFENVWDDHPKWVNLGSQKNFAKYASRIGKEWEKSSDGFNEGYFKRAIARGLMFRATEKLVSAQPWYNGGYRANIVAYTLALMGEITKRRNMRVDFQRVWNAQKVDDDLIEALEIIAGAVNEEIISPPAGTSNVGEWCKKDACWTRIAATADRVAELLPESFWEGAQSAEESATEARSARKTQKIDNGIEAQRVVLAITGPDWTELGAYLTSKRLLTPKEQGIVAVAAQIPGKIPTEKQSQVLIEILEKARLEGFTLRSGR